MFTRDSVERVRDAVDFVELVGAKTELRKSGARRYSGLCPFHEERTPSFGIDPVEKLYYCFGCQASGDVFTFVRETEGLDFPDAVEALASRYGVELQREAEDPAAAARRERRERLLGLLERTAEYYVRVLWSADEAARSRDYLLERGLREEVLRRYRVGYAPSAWDRVLVASRQAGYSEDELHAAGLVQRNDRGQVYDRFRSRITFPLCDVRGQVVGFGARATSDGQQPKYLNSPEGEVFHKGRMVYGADLARASAAKAARVVLCEGYTDVLALSQAGIENAVCSMGTALTEEQARALLQLAPNVTLCLDADAAGQAAALRAYAPLAAEFARGGRHDLRVAALPAGEDPADVVARHGAARMVSLLEAAVPFQRFQVDRMLDGADGADAVVRDRVFADVVEVLRPLPPALRTELVDVVAGRLRLRPELVEHAVAAPRGAAPVAESQGGGRSGGRRGTFKRGRWEPEPFSNPYEHERGPAVGNGAAAALARGEQAERTFLAYCVAVPEEGERRLADADLDTLFSSGETRRAAAYLRGRLATPAADLPPDDEALARLVAELVIRAGELEATREKLDLEALQLDLARVERQVAAARAAGDGERMRALGTEHARIHDAIRHRLQ